jgi:hypothetical protein
LHNPRNVKLNPYCFGIGKVTSARQIKIDLRIDDILISSRDQEHVHLSTGKELNEFARNDGFESWEEMKEFFIKKYKTYFFAGKIIFFDYEGKDETVINN